MSLMCELSSLQQVYSVTLPDYYISVTENGCEKVDRNLQ
jgi:hypothetical protein